MPRSEAAPACAAPTPRRSSRGRGSERPAEACTRRARGASSLPRGQTWTWTCPRKAAPSGGADSLGLSVQRQRGRLLNAVRSSCRAALASCAQRFGRRRAPVPRGEAGTTPWHTAAAPPEASGSLDCLWRHSQPARSLDAVPLIALVRGSDSEQPASGRRHFTPATPRVQARARARVAMWKPSLPSRCCQCWSTSRSDKKQPNHSTHVHVERCAAGVSEGGPTSASAKKKPPAAR